MSRDLITKPLILPQFQEPQSLDEAALTIAKLGTNLHEHAYLVGKTLIWVKKEVGHGNFIQWVKDNVWFSKVTADRFMQYARKCDRKQFLLEYKPSFAVQITHYESFELKPLPPGLFNVIYADPPWQYEFSRSESRLIEAHYESLSIEEICNHKDKNGTPVQDKFADDAVLFLWATQPKIKEALQVIEAWRFDYKTGAIWVKDTFGMGYYFREQHELLFVAKKGNIPTPNPENRPISIIEAPRLKHSQKPEIVYELIEKMYPGGTYLELFARSKRPNWTGWGKEYG